MINSEKAYTYFRNKFNTKKSTNGWWTFDCPVCIERKERKMAVNFNCEIVKCWLCGYRDRIVDFVMMYESLSYFDAKKFIDSFDATEVDIQYFENSRIETISEVDLPFGYRGITEGNDTIARRARAYLTGRGYDLETLDRAGFGYCCDHSDNKDDDYFGYIIIPFKRNGQLVYFIGRDFLGNFLRYKNPPKEKFGVGKADLIFNEDALDVYDTIVVVEGWADAMTVGKKGTSTQGWNLSAYQKGAYMRSDCKNLVFIPDAGVDGQGVLFYNKAVKEAVSFLDIKESVYVVDLNTKELSALGKDVNSIGIKKVLAAVKNTPKLVFEQAIKIISN